MENASKDSLNADYCIECNTPLLDPRKPCPKCGFINLKASVFYQESLDFKKALTSPLAGQNRIVKILPYAFINALGFLAIGLYEVSHVIGIILGCFILIPSIILSGFFLDFQHNVISNEVELFPDLKKDFRRLFINGFKFWVLYLLIVLLACIPSVCIGFWLGLHLGLWGLVMIIPAVLALIVFFASCVIVLNIFADSFSIKKALDFEVVFNLLSKVKVEVLIYFLFWFCLFLAIQLANFVLILTVVGVLIIPFIDIWKVLVLRNLSAQIYKIAKTKLES